MQVFQVSNGDFVLSNGGFSLVDGSDKIQQDLGIATRTPYNSDRFHPRYGSVLDNYVGAPVQAGTEALIKSEITRVINNYQAVQTANMNVYITNGQQPPYSQNDLVAGVKSITVTQDYDTFDVAAVVSTLSGSQTNVQTSVSATSITTGS